MVSDAAATKAPIAKIADRVSGVFVPAVITIAIITIIAWLIAGETVGFALARGISVLVISCPCARTGNSCCDNGRKWQGCKERYTLQDSGKP